MKPRKFFALATALCLVAGYATTIVDLADAATVDIVAIGYNGHTSGTATSASIADYALRFDKDVTIKLDASAAVNGVFTLYANLFATNGGFTIDATGIDTIHWVGGVQTSGKVIVKGARAIHFGENKKLSSPNGKTNFSYFNTDIEFENEAATGLVFTNAVTCLKLPTCPYSITPGMRVAVGARGLLGGGAATFTLEDYDITLVDTKGIAAGTIVVPSGRTLEVRQCSGVPFNRSGTYAGRWTWSGSSNQHVTNNLEFASASVFYVDGGQPNLYLDGDISGETAFTAYISSSSSGTINFTGAVSLGGTVSLMGTTTFDLTGVGPFSFGTVTSADSVRTITGAAGRVLSIAALTANSSIGIGSSFDFRVGTVGSGATIDLLGSGPWSVSGPASGAQADFAGVLSPAVSGGALTVGGLVSLGDLGSTYSALTFLPGTVISNTTFAASTVVSGSVTIAPSPDWKDKVAFWADASDPDSFMTVREFSPNVDTSAIAANKIAWWYDCRNTADWSNDVALAMCRFAASSYSTASGIGKYPNMYPSLSDNSLNGRATVTCSHSTQTRMGIIASDATIRDNYSDWKPVDTAYAMVVARNVKANEGAAVLTTVNGSLCASGKGYNANIFTNEALTVYRDGALVDQTNTTWGNNVWGVYSFTGDGTKVRGLTSKTDPANSGDGSGGFDYAEILLFSEMPTELERKYAEEYLADKWGLPCAHSGTVKADEYTFAPGSVPSDDAIIACADGSIPHSVTVNLSFAARPRPGTYALLSNAEFTSVTLGTVSGIDADRISLKYNSTAKTLSAEVTVKGLVIVFQ